MPANNFSFNTFTKKLKTCLLLKFIEKFNTESLLKKTIFFPSLSWVFKREASHIKVNWVLICYKKMLVKLLGLFALFVVCSAQSKVRKFNFLIFVYLIIIFHAFEVNFNLNWIIYYVIENCCWSRSILI